MYYSTGLDSPDALRKFSTDKARSTMRLLNYPGAPKKQDSLLANLPVAGIAAHTDFECFTILHQSAPGLQIVGIDGEWVDVERLDWYGSSAFFSYIVLVQIYL